MIRPFMGAIGVVAAMVVPELVMAQTPTPQTSPETAPAPAPAPAAPRGVAGYDGVAIESGNGDFRLQIGLLLQFDGRFGLDDDAGQALDTFATRRIRPYLRGRMTRWFEFHLNPDFAGGTFVLQDAYLDTIVSPALRIRAGKGKAPFGLERLHSGSNLLFMERAYPTALAPNRDLGVQALGDIHGGLISYAGGVMNSVTDGGSADLDTTDSKDVVGRLVIRPFNTLSSPHPARGLGLAISGSSGTATGTAALPSFRTQTLQQPYFSYVNGATPAVGDGTRTRYSPQVWYFYKAFGGWAEYVHTDTPIRRDTVRDEVAHDAWQVAASWVLTGENATDAGAGVRPRTNVDFGNDGWGAWQIAVRYHALEVDDAAFANEFASAGASRKVEAWTLGLNWYLTPNVRYTTNFEHTLFDDDPEGPRRPENALAFRVQLFF